MKTMEVEIKLTEPAPPDTSCDAEECFFLAKNRHLIGPAEIRCLGEPIDTCAWHDAVVFDLYWARYPAEEGSVLPRTKWLP